MDTTHLTDQATAASLHLAGLAGLADGPWSRLFDQQQTPPVAVIVGTAVVALALVVFRPVWRIVRNVITIAHEGGHAFVALITGRRLHGIRLHADTSGLTVSAGSERGPSAVFTLLAGYLAPALIGLGASALIAGGLIVLLLWATLALLVAMALFMRNAYGWLAMILVGFGVFALAWWAPQDVQTAVAYGGAWFLLIGAVRPVGEVWRQRSRGQVRDSDPDQLARITRIPGAVWLTLFGAVTLACLVYGGGLLVSYTF